MEEPGTVNKKRGRVKLVIIILPSFFLLLLSIAIYQNCNKKKMDNLTSVKGILLNSAGSPVADAIVMIKDSDYEFNDMASVSNENGEFFLSNIVVPGRYVLEIKYNNASITREVYVPSAQHIIRINL
jgi:hypothetical protein